MAEGYVARLPSRIVPLRAPQNVGAVGQAVAKGIGGLAETGQRIAAQDEDLRQQVAASEQRIAEIEKRRAQQQSIATGMGRLADERIALDREITELRTAKAQPGAAGHEQAVADAITRHEQAVRDALGDDAEVLNHFAGPLSNLRVSVQGQEDGWALNQRVKYGATQADRLGDQLNNGLVGKPDAADWRRNIETMDALFAGMGLEPDQLAMAQRRFANGHTKALLDGLRVGGKWEAAKALIDSGKLDGFLEDNDKQLYLQRFDNDKDIAAREVKAAATETKRAGEEQLNAVKVMIENGEDVPDAKIREAIAAAKAAGVDDDKLLAAGYLAEHAANRRSFDRMTTPALEQQLQGLRAKQTAGQLKPAEARALEDADKALKSRDDNTAKRLEPLLKGGVEGRTMAIGQLAAMPIAERRRVAEAAGDTQAAIIAGLPSTARAWAVAGRQKRLATKEAYQPVVPKGQKPEQEVERQFRDALGAVANDIGGDYGQVRDIALDIMANTTSGWNAVQFERAIQVVAGRTRRGDGSYQGGVGTAYGRKFELPAYWNQTEFDRTFARHPFAGAVYANGSTAKAEDVRRNFRPKFSHINNGNTVYQMIGADGRPLFRKVDGRSEPYFLQFPERP